MSYFSQPAIEIKNEQICDQPEWSPIEDDISVPPAIDLEENNSNVWQESQNLAVEVATDPISRKLDILQHGINTAFTGVNMVQDVLKSTQITTASIIKQLHSQNQLLQEIRLDYVNFKNTVEQRIKREVRKAVSMQAQKKKQNIATKKPSEITVNEDTSNKPFCSMCGKFYSSIQALRSHQKSSHISVGRFACDMCGKRFNHKHHVIRHMESCRKKIHSISN